MQGEESIKTPPPPRISILKSRRKKNLQTMQGLAVQITSVHTCQADWNPAHAHTAPNSFKLHSLSPSLSLSLPLSLYRSLLTLSLSFYLSVSLCLSLSLALSLSKRYICLGWGEARESSYLPNRKKHDSVDKALKRWRKWWLMWRYAKWKEKKNVEIRKGRRVPGSS